jgi:hypothetical protein
MTDVCEPRLNKPEAGAPADGIEVTTAMIDAGRREIAMVWNEFISDSGVEMWSEVLTAVYRAMLAKAPAVPPAN